MKNPKELSLKTVATAIRAIDEQMGKYINIINATSPEILDQDTELMMSDIFQAANDLKIAYNEMTENISNFPPYEKLVTEHPKLNHIIN